MELPDIVDFARNFSVMVRIQGPDPKGLKMRKHAFHHYQSGKTTLSASGFLLPDSFINLPIVKHIRQHSSGSALVVTVASTVEPFLSAQQRESNTQDIPQLIHGVRIDVLVDGKTKEQDNLPDEPDKGSPRWLHSELLALMDVPMASRSLQSLVEAPASSPDHGSWDVGWSLASLKNGHQASVDPHQPQAGHDTRSLLEDRRHSLSESRNPSRMAMSTTRIAFLGVSALNCEDLPNLRFSPSNKRGDLLLAMGSPFGILSPVHFLNSISVGSVANCYPSSSHNSSLLMADIRCLPGMEGGPVFGEHAQLIGIISRPLRQRVGGAEIQLVIPWVAIATVWIEELQNEHKKAAELHISDSLVSHSSPNPIKKAMSSIVLITVDDGAWASGVLLNSDGLILTNAHLLEPWRFGKTTVQGGKDQSTPTALPIIFEELVSQWHERSEIQEKGPDLLPKIVKISDTSKGEEQLQYRMAAMYKSYKKIRVRLDHTNPWLWSDARLVYVSKGPLDVALLQLESVPNQLYPIIPKFECPMPGSKAHVIGHGLFGPRCDAYPSVCSGVVARVVKAQNSHYERGLQENMKRDLPAMLETTAAVHPGGSGGAVVNSDGHMIGLVTSNARHGGGTVIPHLNFSIPCAALAPIFKFSKDMQEFSILEILDKPNDNLSSVWALMPPLSPRQVPVPPFLDPPKSLAETNTTDGKEKGSRFAKFISDRHGQVLPRPNQLVKVESFLKATMPCKL